MTTHYKKSNGMVIMPFEKQYVSNVYNKIATHFDETRYSCWHCVRMFLDKIPSYSLVADFGCGNMKYRQYRKDLSWIGMDNCENLLQIVHEKHNDTQLIHANCINSPLRNNSMDAIISIAVLHHIKSQADRLKFIQCIIDALNCNGRALITVWAFEQKQKQKWRNLGNHDFLIPWTNKTGETLFRYYHLYRKDEITEMFAIFEDQVWVENIMFELDNWCITIMKK